MKKAICCGIIAAVLFSGCATMARELVNAGSGQGKKKGQVLQQCAGKVSVGQDGEHLIKLADSGKVYLPDDPRIRELFENYQDSAEAYKKYTLASESQDSGIRSGVEFFLTGIYSAMLFGYLFSLGGMMEKYQIVRDASRVVNYAFGGLAAFGVTFTLVSGPFENAEQKDLLNEAALKYNAHCFEK
jgi:hypothetical protein